MASEKQRECEASLSLGCFSVSLTVKDLEVSCAFYHKLGFQTAGGSKEQNYLVLRNNEGVTIGLFQGMFTKNMLTFNPGLGQDKRLLTDFVDVRDIRRQLKEQGIEFTEDLDPKSTGPAHISFLDPDGNPILIDQFFPKPNSEHPAENATACVSSPSNWI